MLLTTESSHVYPLYLQASPLQEETPILQLERLAASIAMIDCSRRVMEVCQPGSAEIGFSEAERDETRKKAVCWSVDNLLKPDVSESMSASVKKPSQTNPKVTSFSNFKAFILHNLLKNLDLPTYGKIPLDSG